MRSQDFYQSIAFPSPDFIIGKSLLNRQFTISSTPTLIIGAVNPKPYVLLNVAAVPVTPASEFVAPIFEAELFPLAARVAGTYDSAFFTEAQYYQTARIYIQETVEVGATNLSIRALEVDNLGNTFETLVLNPAVTAIGNYYRFVPADNVGREFGIRVVQTGAGTATWEMRMALKCPCVPQISAASVDNNIYLGNTVNITVQSGFALIPQEPTIIALKENAQLWAVSSTPQTLHVLDMGL